MNNAALDAQVPVAPARVFRVVLVDDTPDLRDLLSLVLDRSPDFRVVGEAGDGRAGLAVVEREQPDVVLLDLAMPVMSGLEALPRMRAALPEARIVVLSGFGADLVGGRTLADGADAYVEKATPAPQILERLRDVLAPGPGVRRLP